MKKFMALVCVAVMVFGNFGSVGKAQAAGPQGSDGEGYAVLRVISYDVESGVSLAVVQAASTGKVMGDGINLRLEPSTSAAILEQMYNGEYVSILGKSSGWYHLKRLKTGTVGWAASKYISLL